MQVAIGGAVQPLRVGLDGVPRIAKRARFSTDSRYEGASIAERTTAGNPGEFAGRPVEGDALKESGR